MARPKAIFFDLDETLVENTLPIRELFGQMFFQFSAEIGEQNQTDFFTALRLNASSLWDSMFEQESSPETQFRDCFAHSLGAIGNQDQDLPDRMFDKFCSLSANNVSFQPGAVETLNELRDAGFITGLITNGIEQLQLGKVASLEIATMVDHVTVSAQARAHKPQRPVFDLALQRAGVQAHEAWQVGDHATNDVAGAIRAGMSGVFYDPTGELHRQAFADLDESPTHRVRHLSEVVSLATS